MRTQPADLARSSVERFLEDFHRRHPAATASLFGVAPAGDGGGSSYDLLLELVPTGPSPITVLDLACGDGFLLAGLAARRQPGLRLIGVDLCAADLGIAAERLGAGGATLLRERAQALSLPDASVDVVLCHMALMLMDDVEAVIASIRRVLRPGGVFSAVVGGSEIVGGDAFEVFVDLIRRAFAEEPGSSLPIGDPRTRSREGLEGLLGEGAGFGAPLEAREVVVRLDAPPAALWGALSLTYDVDLLSPEGRARTEAAFLAAAAPRAREDGTVACSLRLRQVTCRRAE